MSKISEYTKAVRNELKLNQKDFGKKVYHFRKKKGSSDEIECVSCSINTVSKWESDNSESIDEIAFIAIALLDYEFNCNNFNEKSTPYGRYIFVTNKMKEILGYELYARNLHSAILIMVCRGIFTFDEIVNEEEKLLEEINNKCGKKDKHDNVLKEKSIETVTKMIVDEFSNINTKEDFEKIVLKDADYYFSAQNSFLNRLRMVYDYRNRFDTQEKPSYDLAVNVLLPASANSLKQHKFASQITRERIINTLIRLHFNRAEINKVISDYGYMVKLSEEPDDYEFYIVGCEDREKGYERLGDVEEINIYKCLKDHKIGSYEWYLEIDKIAKKKSRCGNYDMLKHRHFGKFFDLKFENQLKLILFITIYIEYGLVGKNVKCIPSVAILLETLLSSNRISKICDLIDEALYPYQNKDIRWTEDEITMILSNSSEIKDYCSDLNAYALGYGKELNEGRGTFDKLYESAASDYKVYLEPTGREQNACEISHIKLHYIIAVTYSILTGNQYDGDYNPEYTELFKGKLYKDLGKKLKLYDGLCKYFDGVFEAVLSLDTKVSISKAADGHAVVNKMYSINDLRETVISILIDK